MKYLSLIAIFLLYALLDAEFLMMQELRAMTNLRLTIYASIGGMPNMLMYITQDIFRNLIFTRTEQE